jgi:hypothetical protein
MNGLYNGNNFIVRLRGLPWNSNQSDVQNFLQGRITKLIFLIKMNVNKFRLYNSTNTLCNK